MPILRTNDEFARPVKAYGVWVRRKDVQEQPLLFSFHDRYVIDGNADVICNNGACPLAIRDDYALRSSRG